MPFKPVNEAEDPYVDLQGIAGLFDPTDVAQPVRKAQHTDHQDHEDNTTSHTDHVDVHEPVPPGFGDHTDKVPI
jgi:hypothetical protein